jgi:hypothetical protein
MVVSFTAPRSAEIGNLAEYSIAEQGRGILGV